MQYPLNFPQRSVATERLVLNRRQSATESPFTFAMQTVSTSSQWLLEFAWPRMSVASAESMRAFLISLKGQVGSFRYYPRQSHNVDFDRNLAQAAVAYQEAISLTGWAAGEETNLRAGQYFQMGAQLLTIIDAAYHADANGLVTVSFAPELRKAHTAGDIVTFANPCGLFRLASSDGSGFTIDPDLVPDLGTIQAREVI